MKRERVAHCPGSRQESGTWTPCQDREGCVRWYLRPVDGQPDLEPRFAPGRQCPDWVPLLEY